MEGAWRLLRMHGTWNMIVSTGHIYISSALTNFACHTHHGRYFYKILVDLYRKLTGHYEWHVAFPQLDTDMGAVRARFNKDGDLVIDVPRSRR